MKNANRPKRASPFVRCEAKSRGDLDGAEVGRQFGERGIATIALTGYADDDHRRRAENAGFKAYLLKPVDAELLDATLRSVVAGKCADAAT